MNSISNISVEAITDGTAFAFPWLVFFAIIGGVFFSLATCFSMKIAAKTSKLWGVGQQMFIKNIIMFVVFVFYYIITSGGIIAFYFLFYSEKILLIVILMSTGVSLLIFRKIGWLVSRPKWK